MGHGLSTGAWAQYLWGTGSVLVGHRFSTGAWAQYLWGTGSVLVGHGFSTGAWAQYLWGTGSVLVQHGLSTCGACAPVHKDQVAVVYGLSCSVVCSTLVLQPGI